ncbi:response regulator [Bradyrhizobium sp.]|uniref:response regulator transcription factor n=1 Tax=Bradyrhizobium sp. TaxID=376 RepID=UPI002389D0ED|nr:response regulator [Bradyrhizobium sp.]MDE2377939.1 response regulator [Bradyrhizobium sp.]
MTIRKVIFVVDDDPSMRTSMKRLLREHGFTARLFGSARALLDHSDFSDALCIVLDVNLDDQSGIELRRRLTDRGVKTPVVYVTGNDSPANRAAALQSGCIAYLTKPFAATSLIESIERAGGTSTSLRTAWIPAVAASGRSAT